MEEQLSEKELADLKAKELDILVKFDRMCKENNLRYFITAGTLLGAVRHKGFIPWDDDIDLMMPREDYEKLLSVWDQSAPKGYILQNTRTDSDFTQNFTKIRKDHTTFLQDEAERTKHYHKGIFVDIFPGDRVPSGKLEKTVQYIACAINLLYSRGHTSGSGGLIGKVENILLRAPKKKYATRRERAEKSIRRWNGNATLQYVFPNTIGCSRKLYPANLFENLKAMEFNGKQYMCAADPDTMLRIEYGDYMQLPPEEERVWKHHPILIDFEHNYEELMQG